MMIEIFYVKKSNGQYEPPDILAYFSTKEAADKFAEYVLKSYTDILDVEEPLDVEVYSTNLYASHTDVDFNEITGLMPATSN